MNILFILINSLRGQSEVFGNSAFSSNQKGFTLIEQLIVIVTIGILIAVAIPIRVAEASSTLKYKYNGVVRDTSGTPVEDATVTVFIANTNPIIPLDVYESQDSETAVSSVTSDSEGFFEFWLDTDPADSQYTTSDIFNIEVTYYTDPDNTTVPPESYNVNNINIFPTIQDGYITHEKLSDDAVTSDKIAADAVTSDKIGDDQVKWNHIADKSIQTTHIVGYDNSLPDGTPHKGAVTTPKIRNNAVTYEKLDSSADAFPRRLFYDSTGRGITTAGGLTPSGVRDRYTTFDLSFRSSESIFSFDIIQVLLWRQDGSVKEFESYSVPTLSIPASSYSRIQIGEYGPLIYRNSNGSIIYMHSDVSSTNVNVILGHKWKD